MADDKLAVNVQGLTYSRASRLRLAAVEALFMRPLLLYSS